MKADNSSVPTPSKNPSKRPRVRCDKQTIAHKVCTVQERAISLKQWRDVLPLNNDAPICEKLTACNFFFIRLL